jgi:excisionase family DNA binding protein
MMSRKDTGEHLGISVRQVDRLIADGQLPCVRVGGLVRVRPEDLDLYLESIANPMRLADAALYLALHPDSVRSLTAVGELPHDRNKSEIIFYKAALERWRSKLAVEPIVFGNMDGEAEHMKKMLAKRGHDVRLLFCDLCEHEVASGARTRSSVAGERCHLCGRVTCLPHALHYLSIPTGPRKPYVVCDECFDVHHPHTLNGGKPRHHRLSGHSSRGSCGRCGDGCPRPCVRNGCPGTVHADDGTFFLKSGEAPSVTRGPACDTCGTSGG